MMKDLILLLILAISGIIGYVVMGRIDQSISHHTAGRDETEQEKMTNEPSEDGKSKRAYSGMSLFLHF